MLINWRLLPHYKRAAQTKRVSFGVGNDATIAAVAEVTTVGDGQGAKVSLPPIPSAVTDAKDAAEDAKTAAVTGRRESAADAVSLPVVTGQAQLGVTSADGSRAGVALRFEAGKNRQKPRPRPTRRPGAPSPGEARECTVAHHLSPVACRPTPATALTADSWDGGHFLPPTLRDDVTARRPATHRCQAEVDPSQPRGACPRDGQVS